MGGCNSGGGRHAPKMDEFHKIDLAEFEGDWFSRLWEGKITWRRAGRITRSVGYRLGPDFMKLSYVAGSGEDGQEINEHFELAFTEQPFGGQRRWLVCPSCCRRCRVLIGGRRFRCRQCYGATYPSQYEQYRCDGLARAEKARERIGAEPGIGNAWPPKPKGMHWKTYRKLETINWNAVLALDRLFDGIT